MADDLVRSTLEIFNHKTGFSEARYLRDYYSTHPVTQAEEHKAELAERQRRVADDLRKYVTLHYGRFIHASKEVVRMETDMGRLTSLMEEYNSHVRALAEVRLSGRGGGGGGPGTGPGGGGRAAEPGDGNDEDDVDEALFNLDRAGFDFPAGSAASAGGAAERAAAPSRQGAELEKRRALREALEDDLPGLLFERRLSDAVVVINRGHETLKHADDSDPLRVLLNRQQATLVEILKKDILHVAVLGNHEGGAGAGVTASAAGGSAPASSGGAPTQGTAARLHLQRLSDERGSGQQEHDRRLAIQHLVELKKGDTALELYLSYRSEYIQREIREIRMSGEVVAYVEELSRVVFRGIGDTCTDLQHLFRDRGMTATMVVWAMDEVLSFAEHFDRHVFHMHDDDVIQRLQPCLQAALGGCRALEHKSVGLALTQVLVGALCPSLSDLIALRYELAQAAAVKEHDAETWEQHTLVLRKLASSGAAAFDDPTGPRSPSPSPQVASGGAVPASSTLASASGSGSGAGAGSAPAPASASASTAAAPATEHLHARLTSSAKVLYELIRQLQKQLQGLLRLDDTLSRDAPPLLYSRSVKGAIAAIEQYVVRLMRTGSELVKESETRSLALLANAYYFAVDIVPRVGHTFCVIFCRPRIPEMDVFARRVRESYEALRRTFCERRARHVLASVFRWADTAANYAVNSDGGHDGVGEWAGSVSEGAVGTLVYMCQLKDLVGELVAPQEVAPVLELVLESFLAELLRKEVGGVDHWKGVSVGRAGLQRLVLDLRFLLEACEGYVSDAARRASHKVINRAVYVYAFTAGVAPATVAGKRDPDSGAFLYPEGLMLQEDRFRAAVSAEMRRLEAKNQMNLALHRPAGSKRRAPPAGKPPRSAGGQ